MRDPSTFEARLADAFEQYAVGAPVAIDSHKLIAGLARRRQVRPGPLPLILSPRSRAGRLALVAAIVAGAAVGGLLVAGAWRTPPQPVPQPLGDSRLLVWLPSDASRGTAALLAGDGTVLASRDMDSRGCPTLVGGSDSLAVPGNGSISIQAVDGPPVDGVRSGGLNTNYTGFERWSPDRRSIALVDQDRGAITVTRLAPSNGGPATFRYGSNGEFAGAIDASFSADGSRLAVAVPRAPGTVEIHVLQDGDARLVRTLGPDMSQDLELAVSPGGGRVALVQQAGSRTGRLTLVDLMDGTISVPHDHSGMGLPVVAVGWSPDGRTLALRSGASTTLLLDASTGAWTDTGLFLHGQVLGAGWSTAPGRPGLALLDASGHLYVHVAGVPDRMVRLAGADAAFSPDASTVVSVGGADGSRQYGTEATVWAVDVWGNRDPWVVASLPAPAAFAGIADTPALAPCVDWLPGGGP